LTSATTSLGISGELRDEAEEPPVWTWGLVKIGRLDPFVQILSKNLLGTSFGCRRDDRPKRPEPLTTYKRDPGGSLVFSIASCAVIRDTLR
jgi:hypothetical protein